MEVEEIVIDVLIPILCEIVFEGVGVPLHSVVISFRWSFCALLLVFAVRLRCHTHPCMAFDLFLHMFVFAN